MRKLITDNIDHETQPAACQDWLDLEDCVQVNLTSEDVADTIESALLPNMGSAGWRAQQTGKQTIRLLFDMPHRISRIQLIFKEHKQERTQEFVLRWSRGSVSSATEIVRQQYNFSPPGTTREREDYVVDLDGLTMLELCIIPDISGRERYASLAQLRLA